MNTLLTEQKVLKKLDIEDFRHLTKDKIITMASMLDKMNPETAKKALEQFPDFSAAVRELLLGYKDTLDKGLASNGESVRAYYDTCNSIVEVLKKQLENDNLAFEERRYVIDRMLEISKMMGEKDSENKKFISALTVVGAAAVGIATVFMAVILGGDTKIEDNDIDEPT